MEESYLKEPGQLNEMNIYEVCIYSLRFITHINIQNTVADVEAKLSHTARNSL